MKRSVFAFVILSAVMSNIACSCNKDDVPSVQQSSKPIVFNITEGGKTRGAQVTTANLGTFGVFASFVTRDHDVSSARLGDFFYNAACTSNTPTAYYWPTSGYMYFDIYAPYNGAGITLPAKNSMVSAIYTVTVQENAASQIDFVTTDIQSISSEYKATLEPTLEHRMANVQFDIRNKKSTAIKIKTLYFYGLKRTGKLQYAIWDNLDNTNTASSHPFYLTANTNVAGNAIISLTGSDKQFFIIPQTIAAGTEIFKIVTEEDGVENTYTYSLPSAYTFSMANVYKFTLNVGKSLTVTSVTVTDWAMTAASTSLGISNWIE